jgi:hypothetical protein
MKHLALASCKSSKLVLLRYFENLHQGPVVDISVLNNKIYTIGLDDKKMNQIVVPSNPTESSKLINQKESVKSDQPKSEGVKDSKFNSFKPPEKIKLGDLSKP